MWLVGWLVGWFNLWLINPFRVISRRYEVATTKTLKMVLDTSLLNTRQYKVRIKGKVEQFWERSNTLPQHLGVVAIEKGAFWLPSTKVANFYIYIYKVNK